MVNVRRSRGKIAAILTAIMALYFAVGIFSVFKYGNANLMGNFKNYDNDDVKYIRSAWTLIDTGMFTYHKVNEPTCYIMPGLTFTLAFFMKIFGRWGGITAFRVFQVVLQTASIYILYITVKKIFSRRTALTACLIDVLSVAEYYAPTLILTETVFKFLLLLLVYVSIEALESKKVFHYAVGGIVWWAACMYRPTIAAYPVVILIMWIIKKYKFKDMVKFTIVTAGVFCILMSPWWVRNYKVFGRFIPLTASSGNPFLQGTYINYDQSVDKVNLKTYKTVIEKNNAETAAGISRLKRNVPKHPFKYMYWYTIGKSIEFWNSPFYWQEMLGISFIAAELYHVLIVLTATIGIAVLFKKKSKSFVPLFLVVLYFNLIHLPYFCVNRYAFPVMPYMSAFSAYFMCWHDKIKSYKINRLQA